MVWEGKVVWYRTDYMLYVLRYLPHLRWRGRKCAAMSLSPASVSAAVISVPLRLFSGSVSVVLRSPATSSAVPRGRSLSAATTLSIVKVSLGAS